jgi:hypothetical protein
MTEEKAQETQVQAEPQAQAAPVENFDLTVQDLNALKQVVEVASQRGAFKAAEMAAVGTIYNKLSGFLDSVSKQGQKDNG